jgi:hypothetical protein
MEENKRPTSMFDSCMKQIMKDGDRVTIQVDMNGEVEFTFRRKNGNFGTHTMEYAIFSTLLNSGAHVEMLLSNWMGAAYNKLLDKEGTTDVRLMI